jgi:integrase
MINRENWKQVKVYIAYLSDVKQRREMTILSATSQLRNLLEWADEIPFNKAPDIRPTFPVYMAKRVSSASVEPACSHARNFFVWLRRTNKRMKALSDIWLETLVSPQSSNWSRQYNEYTLDEVRSMLAVAPDSLRMKRDQAAAAFLFLSGMRVGAFETMPINAVDLENRTVHQWPELGMHTKRDKRATTFLLDIPDLLTSVIAWDGVVRAGLPVDDFWYGRVNPMEQDAFAPRSVGKVYPVLLFQRGLRILCQASGIEYRTPHALRHGFAVYGLKAAKDISDMEAVSKNLMHGSLEITLRVYARLRDEDVKARIEGLGNR